MVQSKREGQKLGLEARIMRHPSPFTGTTYSFLGKVTHKLRYEKKQQSVGRLSGRGAF